MNKFVAVFRVLQDERATALELRTLVSFFRPFRYRDFGTGRVTTARSLPTRRTRTGAGAVNLGACPASAQRNQIVVVFAWAFQDRCAASLKNGPRRRPLRLVGARGHSARGYGGPRDVLGPMIALVAGPARLNARPWGSVRIAIFERNSRLLAVPT